MKNKLLKNEDVTPGSSATQRPPIGGLQGSAAPPRGTPSRHPPRHRPPGRGRRRPYPFRPLALSGASQAALRETSDLHTCAQTPAKAPPGLGRPNTCFLSARLPARPLARPVLVTFPAVAPPTRALTQTFGPMNREGAGSVARGEAERAGPVANDDGGGEAVLPTRKPGRGTRRQHGGGGWGAGL